MLQTGGDDTSQQQLTLYSECEGTAVFMKDDRFTAFQSTVIICFTNVVKCLLNKTITVNIDL